MSVWILGALFDTLADRALDPELLRKSFENFKAGDEFQHVLFCHDRGADPGCYLSHVHFIPTDQAEQAKWLSEYNNRHRRKLRTSDRYVLYAQSSTFGILLIDILDDPGAHSLWENRRTKLAGYEKTASDFCTHGRRFHALDCR